jgi:uncharacterized SAM-binding protein YcdF (DUF218 family)
VRARLGKGRFLVLPALLLLAIPLTSDYWLRGAGSFLVRADEPAQAEYAVVLAGGGDGNRILTASELARRGLVRKVIVDGPKSGYGLRECDMAVDFAVKHGYPAEYFLKLPMDATSTQAEARYVMAELRRLGARSFLLVTSNYHTRRARTYFRELKNVDMRVIASPDEYFQPDSWWKTREGQKIVYMEWSKTVAAWLGM